MALEGSGKFVRYERSRTLIYVSAKVCDDSNFPFQPGDALNVRIDRKAKRLIVELADSD